jgi:exopolysaccharide biosynthesis predicted pyruvyltransferase EpsI
VPDLSLSGVRPNFEQKRSKIVVSDSVRLNARKILAKIAQVQNAHYIPIKTLQGKLWSNELVKKLLWRIYNSTFTGDVPHFTMPATIDEYLNELLSTKSHITGRFHGACLSILTLTPFLAIRSTTGKVENLISDIGLDASRLVSNEALIENPFIFAPEFSDLEVKNIKIYLNECNRLANNLFDDILRLL